MYPCSSCHRHLREADTTCPFCGAEQRTIGFPVSSLATFVLAAATVLGSSACAVRPSPADDGMSTTSAGESGSEADSESVGESSSTMGDGDGDTADDNVTTCLAFYAGCNEEDIFGQPECDPFFQDCPDGEKCVPHASEGGPFDANKCVPVFGDGQPGDPCTYGGTIESTDDCDASSFCFQVEEVDGMSVGVCTPFCEGTADAPECPPDQGCLIANDGSINLCLSMCLPLMQDCPAGQMCAWVNNGSTPFLCMLEPDAAPANGEPCTGQVDACGLGQVCASAEVLPDCAGQACCTEYCDISDPDFTCTNPNLTCSSLWGMETPPPGHENVGACVAIAP